MIQKEEILKHHKKRGKKFIPPLLDFNFTDTSYVDYIIPEIIWISLLNDKYGIQLGTKISVEFVKIINNYFKKDDLIIRSFISSIELIKKSDLDEIIKQTEILGIDKHLNSSLKDFISLYPKCPLCFLLQNEKIKQNNEYLKYYKNLLLKLFDKRTKEATFSQANVLYHLFALDKLKIVEDSPLSKFPQLRNYPNTEISKLIASSVRASINLFSKPPFYNEHNNWNSYFWNRGLELESCKI